MVSTLTVRIAVAVSSFAGEVIVGKSMAARVFGFTGPLVAIMMGGSGGIGMSPGMSTSEGVPYVWPLLVGIN